MNKLIIPTLIIASITLGFFLGQLHEVAQYEKEIELSLEAAAQAYKKAIPNDTSRFDYYGNDRFQKESSQNILPQNAPSKEALWQSTKNPKIQRARK